MKFKVGTIVDWLGWTGQVIVPPKAQYPHGSRPDYPVCVIFDTKDLMGDDEIEFFTSEGRYFLGQVASLKIVTENGEVINE